MQSSSNLALVMVREKSSDSASESTSMVVWAEEDKILLAFSAWVLRRLMALGLLLISTPFLFKKSAAQYSTSLLSKSSPPKWVSPAVALTSKNVGWWFCFLDRCCCCWLWHRWACLGEKYFFLLFKSYISTSRAEDDLKNKKREISNIKR